jgi:hypothetical protein
MNTLNFLQLAHKFVDQDDEPELVDIDKVIEDIDEEGNVIKKKPHLTPSDEDDDDVDDTTPEEMEDLMDEEEEKH